MMVRMRGISITPVEDGHVSTIGGKVQIANASVPEVDFSYFFNENFALELILATATHKVGVHGTSVGSNSNIDLGSVSLLPPTLLAQYHRQYGKFKPYLGAGVNYTVFYGADQGSNDAVKNVSYDNSFGYAFQVGTDYEIAQNTYINFDVKKLYLDTKATVKTSLGTVTSDVDIDPWIIGLGIGYRF